MTNAGQDAPKQAALLPPPERPATRRLETALVRLEAAVARAAHRRDAARALEQAAAETLATLDRLLADG